MHTTAPAILWSTLLLLAVPSIAQREEIVTLYGLKQEPESTTATGAGLEPKLAEILEDNIVLGTGPIQASPIGVDPNGVTTYYVGVKELSGGSTVPPSTTTFTFRAAASNVHQNLRLTTSATEDLLDKAIIHVDSNCNYSAAGLIVCEQKLAIAAEQMSSGSVRASTIRSTMFATKTGSVVPVATIKKPANLILPVIIEGEPEEETPEDDEGVDTGSALSHGTRLSAVLAAALAVVLATRL